jgi:hypothetical protein
VVAVLVDSMLLVGHQELQTQAVVVVDRQTHLARQVVQVL